MKAAHAVMPCEMERGILTWEDTKHIDIIYDVLMLRNITVIQNNKIGEKNSENHVVIIGTMT